MFKLPQEVKTDLENYRNSLKELLGDRVTAARFKGVRVPWGIYNQRGGKIFMNRIRIPAGVVSAAQLKALAYASKEYGSGMLHITTRQDIQIHDVKIEDTIKVMDYLKEYDLSPRGGGGNTVRNVIACPLSGICKDEVFDVRNYAIGLTEYLLCQDTSFVLPRKFKISFSGCSKDCAGCLVNDLGLLAQSHDGKKGFKVFVGGGMGAHPRTGKLLEEFIPLEDLGYIVSSVKDVFYKKGDRRNKHHNRLRFLIEDIGLEEFKQLYKKEFEDLKEKEHIVLRKIDLSKKEDISARFPQKKDKDYTEFLKYDVLPQKQKGYSTVALRIPRGDISAEELIALADLEKDYDSIEFRTSGNQNIFICWVKNTDVYEIFLKLKEKLGDFLYAQTLLDVVACKGALTCNLGLCNSPALSAAIEGIVRKDFIGKKVFKKLEIKINGCPNACGHHPVGKISFYGMVKRVDNRPLPFYKLFLGGRKEAERTRLAHEVGIVPAKNIPDFLREFLNKTEEKIKQDTDIYEFLENGAETIAKKTLENYAYVPSYSENKDFYIDWGRTDEFSLDGLGPGECGAGILDMIESDLLEAKIALDGSEKEDYSLGKIKKALFNLARSLLVVKGIDPKTAQDAFENFKEKFIKEGIASSDYSNIENVYENIKDDLESDEKKEKFNYAKNFFEHINSIYKSMDHSLNFAKLKEGVKQGTPEAKERTANFLDLKGTPCPMNYVKAKLALENLNSGDLLEIILDEGEPVKNVPRSLKDDGHQVLTIEKQEDFYKIVVKKS